MREIIRIRCLKHIYPDKTEVKVCGLDFIVHERERVAILGENGSGKTTLLNHILGLLKPVEGEITVFGCDPVKNQKKVIKKIGVVFQNVDEQIIGPTVYDDIAFAPRNYGFPEDRVDKMVKEVSERMGITHLLHKIPHYLSGGQKKKVALAGAMVLKPELLILDEPFNGLDPKSKEDIIKLLREINLSYGTALLLTSHDINFLPEIVDKIYILHDGRIIRYGSVEEVLQERDFLYQVSLRPPILVELFSRLRNRGIEVEIPINIDQAEVQLLNLLKSRGEVHWNGYRK
ncbi:ABC transporter [Anoxybacter fermentans]|uniref:ABC transporter n=1 Tax=Anoxybacter fermentans TaxID=1323375 RepID=A0A3S9SVK3_9FIRM|nr:energy-coupling factor ABC transporter ATP-binding protein [Anoxybacter fermentans]AZR72331.1 ABC transporter [Anoxybacter fermentans]